MIAFSAKTRPLLQQMSDMYAQTAAFQGKEWLSSRLMLMALVPVMVQFSILPLIDIGGTLDISAYLEAERVKFCTNF